MGATKDMLHKHDNEKFLLLEEQEALRKNKDSQIAKIIKNMEEERHQNHHKLADLKEIIITREHTINEKNSQILALEELLSKKQDIEDQMEEALNREEESQRARKELQKEIEKQTKFVLELEEKVYRSNKTSLELLKQLKEAEIEISTLQGYVSDLQNRVAVYIPVKNDLIDKTLGDFINNYSQRNKLKIMFMRESEGIYQFGSRKVAIKVDQDRITVRVGGGYISVEEFLEQYTPQELEKMEHKNPVKRMTDKIAVQNRLNLLGAKEKREISPVHDQKNLSPSRRSPTRGQNSPTRNSTAIKGSVLGSANKKPISVYV